MSQKINILDIWVKKKTRYASLRKTDFSCNKALIKNRSFEQNTD